MHVSIFGAHVIGFNLLWLLDFTLGKRLRGIAW